MLMIRTFTKILVTSLVLSAELTAQQCDGAGFGGGLIEAGTWSVEVTGSGPAAEALAQNFIKDTLMPLPTNCPTCPTPKKGCAPGRLFPDGAISWSVGTNPQSGNPEVTATAAAPFRWHQTCGLCYVVLG